MAVERIAIVGQEDWHAYRKQVVGASEIAAVCGISPWKSPLAVYHDKLGTLPPQEMNDAMASGLDAEPMAIAMLKRRYPEWEIVPGQTYYRDLDLRLGATPDAFGADADGRYGIVQIKTTRRRAFEAEWLSASGDLQIPTYYQLQMLVEAELTGAKWAMAAVVVWTDDGPVLYDTMLDLEHDDSRRAVEAIKRHALEFWGRIERRDPPPVTPDRDREIIGALYRHDNGETLDLSTNNRAVEVASQIAALQDVVSMHGEGVAAITKELEGLKTEMRSIMGEAAAATVGEWKVTCKTIKRAAIPATTYRRFCLKAARVTT